MFIDGPCPLCEEDEQIGYCRYRNTEQENASEIKNDAGDEESQEFKRDSEVIPEEIAEENWTVVQEPEERKIETKEEENKTEASKTEDTKQKSTEEEQNKKADNAESDEQSKEEEQESMLGLKDDEIKTDDEDDDDDDEEASDLLVPPLEDDCILQMGPDCTIDLVMVCDQPRCMNEDLSLCPPKSSDFSQPPPMKSPPRPLSITLPPQNPTILPFQPHPLLQAQVPAQAQLEPQCLGKRPYGSNPAVDPQGMRPLEVTLRQVYTTRQYTRFANRAALMPLASVGGETSTQALPSISTDIPLMPPKKKTRTFYSTGERTYILKG